MTIPSRVKLYTHTSAYGDKQLLAGITRADKFFMKRGYMGYSIAAPWLPLVAAWDGDKLAGFVLYDEHEGFVNVIMVWVEPKYRGCKLTRRMLNAVPVDKPLCWAVHINNKTAIAAYLRIGATMNYLIDGQITCHYDRRALGVYE